MALSRARGCDLRIGAKILVLSSHDDRDTVLAAVDAGAAGYLLKTADAADIREAIRRVAAGEIVFPAAQAELCSVRCVAERLNRTRRGRGRGRRTSVVAQQTRR